MRQRPTFPVNHVRTAERVRFDRADLALYWGYVQGADRRTLHETYFPEVDLADLRHVRGRVRAIAQALAAAARRSARPELAALFLRDPGAIAGGAVGAPTLDEFRATEDPDGFYGDKELLALWHEAYSGDAVRRAEQRRSRLRVRIREALSWIETQIYPVPAPEHRVDAWIPQAYARRLQAVGIETMRDLVAYLNRWGTQWHRKVPGIGRVKAEEIRSWVLSHEQPGLRLAPSSTMTPVQLVGMSVDRAPATPIVPLERLQLPHALDGSQGRFRSARDACTLEADNDLDAIRAWITAKTSPHTRRAYTRETERLLLWCLLVAGKPVSSMTVEDCNRYRAFLRDPQPAERWCAPRGTPRWSRAWRPFEGPLSAAGERHALIILKAMAGWLKEQNYVSANPWAALSIATPSRVALDKSRAFTPAQWKLIREELEQLPDKGARPRLKFALWLLLGTGMRLEEAVSRRMEHLVHATFSDGTSALRLKVLGKRSKERVVPFASELHKRLAEYMATRGFADLSDVPSGAFLLARAADGSRMPGRLAYEAAGGIDPDTLYRQLRGFFRLVAKRCAASQPEAAARIQRASTHWLRHTCGTRLAAATKDVVLVRDVLGHASIATTSGYLDGDEIRQQRAVEKMLASA